MMAGSQEKGFQLARASPHDNNDKDYEDNEEDDGDNGDDDNDDDNDDDDDDAGKKRFKEPPSPLVMSVSNLNF